MRVMDFMSRYKQAKKERKDNGRCIVCQDDLPYYEHEDGVDLDLCHNCNSILFREKLENISKKIDEIADKVYFQTLDYIRRTDERKRDNARRESRVKQSKGYS